MGTWTASATFESDTSSKDGMSMHISTFITGDTAGVYKLGCGCDSMENNEVCGTIKAYENQEFSGYYHCEAIEKTYEPNEHGYRVKGGDALVYFNFGTRFKIAEFGVDEYVTTNGWVGPFSILLPDDDSGDGRGGNRTALRYLSTPLTDLLAMPWGYNVTDSKSDFPRLFGPYAVNATTQIQAKDVEDPFIKQYDTCDNGDAAPVLPLIGFTYDEQDKLNVKFKYQAFTYSGTDTIVYKLKIMEKLKKKGFPIKGPYCFNGEKVAYTVDFDFDSLSPAKNVNFDSGCVEGYPCQPDLMDAFQIGSSDIHAQQKATIELQITIYFIIATAVLFLMLCASLCWTCAVQRKHKEVEMIRGDAIGGSHSDALNTGGSLSAMGGGYDQLLNEGEGEEGGA